MIPVKRKAINLKINGIACEGTFYYIQNQDITGPTRLILSRESSLEFTISWSVATDHKSWLMALLELRNKEESVEDNGKLYKGFMTDWNFDEVSNTYSCRMVMIDKWYD